MENWEIPRNMKASSHCKNRKCLLKAECPAISQNPNPTVELAIWIHSKQSCRSLCSHKEELVWTPCLMHRCVCIWQYILQNYNYKLHFQNLSIYLMFAQLVTCEIATYSWPLEKTRDGKYSISLAAAPGPFSLSLLFSPLSLSLPTPAFFLVGYSQK
jgi:hypothetical protein